MWCRGWPVAASLLFLPGVIRAQLSVDRLEVVMRTDHPEERIAVIEIRNQSAANVQALVRLEDWNRSDEGTNRWHPYGSQPGSCHPILSAFPLAVSLDAGASETIRISLDSTSLPATECWAAAIIESAAPASGSSATVRYAVRTAVKIYVAPPALRADGEIRSFSEREEGRAEGAHSAQSRQLEFTFVNSGGRHVVANGTLEFRRADNSLAASFPVAPIYTLPGARWTARISVPRLPPGRYVALLLLDYGGSEIAAAQLDFAVP